MEEQNEPLENKPMNPTPESESGQEETTPQVPEQVDSGQPEADAAIEHIAVSGMQKELDKLNDAVNAIRSEVGKVIVGQTESIDLMLAGILSGGHILLEGVPGIAKTLTAKLLSETLDVKFSRIQFTPDMMPTDVIGTNVFNVKNSEFEFKSGPVFANVVLIDEINRAPAKTQSALFEVMQEKQITLDGTQYEMSYPFFVVATQNPVEQEGTYKLPEAQLDRFLFRIKMDYPELSEEEKILFRFRDTSGNESSGKLKPVLTAENLRNLREIVAKVKVKDELLRYIAAIIHETRNNPSIYLGASPRASLAIMHASKAMAAMAGRDFVTPDDIKTVAGPVLNHRLILSPDREMEGTETEEVIDELFAKIEVPR